MLSSLDILIILASMILVIGVGVTAGRRKSDTAHGHFLGGNKRNNVLVSQIIHKSVKTQENVPCEVFQ
jgi:Na+/proline symporter